MKHEINLPGADEFAHPQTRRGFFKALAVAGAGAAVATTATTRNAYAQSGSGDLKIANFALTLEYLEATFYAKALDAGVLSGDALSYIQAIGDHESQHVDALVGLIKQFGGTPTAKPDFTFPSDAFSSQDSVLKLASTFEPVGVGAYLGAAPLIQSPDVLAAAGSIAGVEGEHVVAINNLIGVLPPAQEAFPKALTKDEVLSAVAPFLGMAPMSTGGASPDDWYRLAHV